MHRWWQVWSWRFQVQRKAHRPMHWCHHWLVSMCFYGNSIPMYIPWSCAGIVIAAIVIAGIVLMLIGISVYCCCCKKNNAEQRNEKLVAIIYYICTAVWISFRPNQCHFDLEFGYHEVIQLCSVEGEDEIKSKGSWNVVTKWWLYSHLGSYPVLMSIYTFC